jgi:hypothetical protein
MEDSVHLVRLDLSDQAFEGFLRRRRTWRHSITMSASHRVPSTVHYAVTRPLDRPPCPQRLTGSAGG